MKRVSVGAVILSLVAFPCWAGMVSERWGGKGTPCTHPDTLKVVQGKTGPRFVFDLSAIPKGATVHRASLYCFTQGGVQPTDPAKILLVAKLDAEGNPVSAGPPLKLEAPWYRSFDATEAVRLWAKEPATNLGLLVAQFERILAPKSYLEVVYETELPSRGSETRGRLPERATGLRVAHHDGQTFISWTEAADFRPKAEEVVWVEKFSEKGDKLAAGPGQGAYDMPNHPGIALRALRRLQGLGLRDQKSGFQGIKDLKRVREAAPITYRLYRHSERITAANIHEAVRLAEVEPLSGLDSEVYQIHFQGEYLDQWEEPSSVIPTLCTDKGKPLAPGEGIYVHTVHTVHSVRPLAGAFYAVTVALAGTENLAQITDANSSAQPVAERADPPLPVLQWIQEDRYHEDVPEYWYRYWAAPPFHNLPSRSFRVAVSVPRKLKEGSGAGVPPAEARKAAGKMPAPQPARPPEPCPLIIGSISGDFNLRESLNLPSRTAVTIAIQDQLDWLPALFFNEGRGSLRGMTDCKVDYFPERYTAFLIHWIMRQHTVDRSKISGSMLHFGLRHPEIFPRMSFGAYTANYDYRWAPGGSLMPSVLGPKGIQTAQGEDAWKMFSVAEYVNAHPDRDIPFLLCISATGTDSGHTSEFGWQDDPRGWAGLLKARQPFVATWSLGPPRELSEAFEKMRWDTTLPAFSRCSLDNNPGNGDPADGDYYGTINGWLLWDDGSSGSAGASPSRPVDSKDAWEMSVWLLASCPESACTVDITPRHCKEFRPAKSQAFQWTNSSLAEAKVVQQGMATADAWGLVTLKDVQVTKGRNRIRIARQ